MSIHVPLTPCYIRSHRVLVLHGLYPISFYIFGPSTLILNIVQFVTHSTRIRTGTMDEGRQTEKRDLRTIQVFHRIEAADPMQEPHVHMEHDIHHLGNCHRRPA